MSKFKIPFIFAFIMLTSLNYAQHTDQINSNRPGVTMSACGRKIRNTGQRQVFWYS
jgi:hypothetical protein